MMKREAFHPPDFILRTGLPLTSTDPLLTHSSSLWSVPCGCTDAFQNSTHSFKCWNFITTRNQKTKCCDVWTKPYFPVWSDDVVRWFFLFIVVMHVNSTILHIHLNMFGTVYCQHPISIVLVPLTLWLVFDLDYPKLMLKSNLIVIQHMEDAEGIPTTCA